MYRDSALKGMLLSKAYTHARVHVVSRAHPYYRQYHVSAEALAALDEWIAQSKRITSRMDLIDTLDSDRVQDLYTTLPTRDGTPYAHTPPVGRHDSSFREPRYGHHLSHGHHLAFFHPRVPEPLLRPDGTDSAFCPPEPFVRRMWAGGYMEWQRPIEVGAEAIASHRVGAVEKKGFGVLGREKGLQVGAEGESKTPMVFVKQNILIAERRVDTVDLVTNIIEECTHVYLPLGLETKRSVRKLEVPEGDFSFTYTPTPTTLFRFSALTFNAHHIHLDKDYAQKSEGYPERLVHAPLTALMMLDTLAFHRPDIRMRKFEYRAVNPIIVNRPCIIKGSWRGDHTVLLWAEDGDGVVGMQGVCEFA